ncbi:hypothetical protein [Streptomyces lasalocidi]|uniref:Uncharacterized protein n=1 Tax=Streptomyces lasalocidi TaxID=324833 RepID=A0A4U5W4F9_STRLS|nr:hypothetical protein [Streptomyces lasalocidi]TKS96334.1 hypothetical protein E4U91_37310 [Streptomyces lasalocidi]
MTTVLFVHGTGVRKASYDATFALFSAGLAAVRPRAEAARCYWGDAHGARLNAGGVSVPAGESDRGPGDVAVEPSAAVDAAEADAALWGLLERDPLFELRLAGAEGAFAGPWAGPGRSVPDGPFGQAPHPVSPPPGVASRGEELLDVAALSADDPDVADAASAAGLDAVLAAALEAVLNAEVLEEALEAEPETLGDSWTDGDLRVALARAVVAQALRMADERLEGTWACDGDHRDALVAALVAALGGSDRGVGAAVGKFGLNVALRLGATRPLERRRSALTEASAPAAGDVLHYLARGEALRGFLAEAVHPVGGPVVLVAHSLGGIACAELLADLHLPAVELLVTVGSQAPLLYELDALPVLPFGRGLPASFPRWVNVYDRRDLLGYVGEGVFPGRVEDRVIDNRTAFPRAHSAYFGNRAFYSVLDEVLPPDEVLA